MPDSDKNKKSKDWVIRFVIAVIVVLMMVPVAIALMTVFSWYGSRYPS